MICPYAQSRRLSIIVSTTKSKTKMVCHLLALPVAAAVPEEPQQAPQSGSGDSDDFTHIVLLF